MGQSESCFSQEQSQSDKRRHKRQHGAEGPPLPPEQVQFLPAKHALADPTTNIPALIDGELPSSSAVARVGRPRKAMRRLFGGQGNSQPSTSAVAYSGGRPGGQIKPIDVSLNTLQPVRTASSGAGVIADRCSQNQDEEMVDASALSLSQSSQPHKKIKLEMEIDSADGSITGRVLVGASDNEGTFHNVGPNAVLLNIPSQVCTICKEQIRAIGNAQEDSHQSSQSSFLGSQLQTLEEMNRAFDRNEAHHLYALERELMTDVGYIDQNNIVGFIEERKSIEEEILSRLNRPDLFDGLRKFTATGVLISGHEGNGKTTLARMIASYINYRYINVRPYYFDSEAKYERLIGIFRLARRTQPAVIIFDAADQLSQSTNQMFGKSKKLQQLFVSEFRNSVQSGDQIVVIITMNSCPHHLPRGIYNCFEHKIYLSLPNDAERAALLSLNMKGANHCLSQIDFQLIADLTPGYPRGQIANLCRMAASVAAKGVVGSDKFQAIRSVTRDDFMVAINKLSTAEFCNAEDSTSGRTSTTSTMSVSPTQSEDDKPETGHMSDVD